MPDVSRISGPSVSHVVGVDEAGRRRQSRLPEDASFDALLSQQLAEGKDVRFSAHAAQRLRSRNINLNVTERFRLNEAVERVEKKGVRESLVLLNDLAFIVSVKNRTVVTAIDRESLKEKVFTNIDSAVIL